MQWPAIMMMPSIDRYMTRQPWTTSAQSSLADAHELMHAHQIRHLPVLDAGALVGVMSERDIHLLRSIAGVSLHETRVREAMSEPVYVVAPSAALDQVVATMSEHKYGSAVVVDAHGAVAGIFTTVDACSALSELLQRATA
ncbi:MAG TPA: CBS domain-containing protein [Kofleriaceae bacterium]|nr:CBS domain-containing protein [Kofleriaceae bacterium]